MCVCVFFFGGGGGGGGVKGLNATLTSVKVRYVLVGGDVRLSENAKQVKKLASVTLQRCKNTQQKVSSSL